MEEFDIINGNNHNREMLVQERTETGEFEKGHPVGYINKYGKQKQGDGSWKYVGKGTSAPAASKTEVKPSMQVFNRTMAPQGSSHLYTFPEAMQSKVNDYVKAMAANADSSVLRSKIKGALADTERGEKYSRTLTVRHSNRLFTLYSSYGNWRIGAGGTEGTNPKLVKEIIPKLEKEIIAVAGPDKKMSKQESLMKPHAGKTYEFTERGEGERYTIYLEASDGSHLVDMSWDNMDDAKKYAKKYDFPMNDIKKGENLKGGLGDNKTLEDLAKLHKVDIKTLQTQVEMGLKVEMEHTDSKTKAKEIVIDHLTEDSKYYTKLKTIEKAETMSEELIKAHELLELEDFAKAHPVGYINKYGKRKEADGTWTYVGVQGGGATATAPAGTDTNAEEGSEDHSHLLKDIENIARNQHTPEQKMKELIDVGLKDVGKISTVSGLDRSAVAAHFVQNNITPKPSNIDADKFKNLLPKVEVKKRWSSYRVMLNMVAKGTSKSMIAYGTGGVGKTYNMKKVFEGHRLKEFEEGMTPGFGDYDFVKITGKSTPTAMYKALYEHNGKIVVFDDCDSVLKDETSINILKGALDTTGDGTITYGSSVKLKDGNGEEIPQRFSFVGRAAFISNLMPNEMPQPLRSRALTVDLSMTADETLTMLKEIVHDMPFQNNRGEAIQVSAEDRNAAVALMEKYKNQIDIGDLNARTLGQIALVKKQMSENPQSGLNWEDVAISMLS